MNTKKVISIIDRVSKDTRLTKLKKITLLEKFELHVFEAMANDLINSFFIKDEEEITNSYLNTIDLINKKIEKLKQNE